MAVSVLKSRAEHPAGEIDHSCRRTDRFGDSGFVSHGSYPFPGDGKGPGERTRRPGGEDWPIDENEVGRHGGAEYPRFATATLVAHVLFLAPIRGDEQGAACAFIIDRGEGIYVYDESGRRYLDAAASLWYMNVGYGRTEIIDAVAEQMRKLPAFMPSSTTEPGPPSTWRTGSPRSPRTPARRSSSDRADRMLSTRQPR